MMRIILVIDAMKFNAGSLDFAISIAQATAYPLTGLFINEGSSVSIAAQLHSDRDTAGMIYPDDENRDRTEQIRRNIAIFNDGCQAAEVVSETLLVDGHAQDIILRESRFADLLILPPDISFNDDVQIPTSLVKNVLADAECPVLVTAEIAHSVDEVVIAFDGSNSSAVALKQFRSALSCFSDKRIILLHITETGKSDRIGDFRVPFESWMKANLPAYTLVEMQGNASDILFNYFFENQDNNKLLVAGGFGRSAISRFFSPGTTEMVMKVVDIPLFIAHK